VHDASRRARFLIANRKANNIPDERLGAIKEESIKRGYPREILGSPFCSDPYSNAFSTASCRGTARLAFEACSVSDQRQVSADGAWVSLIAFLARSSNQKHCLVFWAGAGAAAAEGFLGLGSLTTFSDLAGVCFLPLSNACEPLSKID